jgi:protein TonB
MNIAAQQQTDQANAQIHYEPRRYSSSRGGAKNAAARRRGGAEGWRRYSVPVIVAVIFLAAAFGIYKVASGGDTGKKRVIETIALKIVPPPPPKVEPPPEPPKMVEEQKIQPPIDKPMDSPKDAPPPGPLALDSKGGPGSDAFGLGGKAGGSDFLGDGGGGTRFGHYAVLMQEQISRSLHSDDKLNADQFRATIKVWLSNSGKIERVAVLHTSGNSETDNRIEQVIAAMPALSEAPPTDMPQPVIVRIGAKSAAG